MNVYLHNCRKMILYFSYVLKRGYVPIDSSRKKICLMSIQRKLTYFSIGGILLYCWALFSTEVLLPRLTSIVALIASVILLATLYFVTVVVAIKMNRKRNGKDGLVVAIVITLVVLFMSYFATSFVLDTGMGAGLRENRSLDFLPDGNLLVAGGRAGWTLLVLFTTLVVSLLWNKLKGFNKPTRARVSKPVSRKLEPPKTQTADERKPFTQHPVSSGRDTDEFFSGL